MRNEEGRDDRRDPLTPFRVDQASELIDCKMATLQPHHKRGSTAAPLSVVKLFLESYGLQQTELPTGGARALG